MATLQGSIKEADWDAFSADYLGYRALTDGLLYYSSPADAGIEDLETQADASLIELLGAVAAMHDRFQEQMQPIRGKLKASFMPIFRSMYILPPGPNRFSQVWFFRCCFIHGKGTPRKNAYQFLSLLFCNHSGYCGSRIVVLFFCLNIHPLKKCKPGMVGPNRRKK